MAWGRINTGARTSDAVRGGPGGDRARYSVGKCFDQVVYVSGTSLSGEALGPVQQIHRLVHSRARTAVCLMIAQRCA